VLGLVIEIERLSQMGKRPAELATKHKADALPVRYQLGHAVISAFRKLKQFVCQFMTGTDPCAIEQVREGAGPGSRYLCSPRRVAAQLAGTCIGFTGLRRGPPLGCSDGPGERKMKRPFIG
jgi:hypothetical protein